jgi:hypothetical protein
MSQEKTPFQQAIEIEEQLRAPDKDDPAKPSPTRKRQPKDQVSAPQAGRDVSAVSLVGRKRPAATVAFSQRIDKDTAEGLRRIALQKNWTMNQTVTEAFTLLDAAIKEGKL